MKTLQTLYVEALIGLGYARLADVQKTRKYIVLNTSKNGGNYYVGTRGSLRIGRSRTLSYPVTDKQKEDILRLYREHKSHQRRLK